MDFGTNTSINMFGFNATNGKLVWNINDDTFNLETMDYDPVTGTTKNASHFCQDWSMELDWIQSMRLISQELL